eukprot:TRINITY_DN7291_c0_g1_i5.p1 TRINITY_DN7291_c0_g1~~TRINITY_DN7291_c0_g1_i5.p1  ORF type:complete len:1224 (-),score=235.64 TRINITY_DN7291_c0_g1_i5:29-3700(-)
MGVLVSKNQSPRSPPTPTAATKAGYDEPSKNKQQTPTDLSNGNAKSHEANPDLYPRAKSPSSGKKTSIAPIDPPGLNIAEQKQQDTKDSSEIPSVMPPQNQWTLTTPDKKEYCPKPLSDSYYTQRIIRVYLSSTPETQAECEYFLKNDALKIEKFCHNNFYELIFVDLRATPTPAKDEALSNLQKSLESIDKCHYFVGILGRSLGADIPNDPQMAEIAPLASALKLSSPRSQLEYEIHHAVLKETSSSRRGIFLARSHDFANPAESKTISSSNPQEEQKTGKLVSSIKSSFPLKTYHGLADFSESLSRSLIDAISNDWKDPRHVEVPEKYRERDQFSHWYTKTVRVSEFQGRDVLLKQLRSQVEFQFRKEASTITVVTGESGMGKTSLMSALAQQLESKQDPNLIVFYHIASSSRRANSLDLMMHRLQTELALVTDASQKSLGGEEKSIEAHTKMRLDHILKDFTRKFKEKKLAIILDGLNQFMPCRNYPNSFDLAWLPKTTPANVAIIVATTENHTTHMSLQESKVPCINLGELDDADIIKLANYHMSESNIQLSDHHTRALLGKKYETGNPLYFQVAMLYLKEFEGADFDLEFRSVMATKNLFELSDYIVNKLRGKYGAEVVRCALAVICVSRIGLSEKDLDNYLLKMLEKTSTAVVRKSMILNLMRFFTARGGRYTFIHQLLWIAIKRQLFDKELVVASNTRDYGVWLHKAFPEPEDDIVIAEICYALQTGGLFEPLVKFLQKKNVVQCLLNGPFQAEFIACWDSLNRSGYDHKSVYVDLVKDGGVVGKALRNYFQDVEEHDFLLPILIDKVSAADGDGLDDEVFFNLGQMYKKMKKYEKSREAFSKSLEIKKKLKGETHPELIDIYELISSVYLEENKHEKALEYYKLVLEGHIKLHGENALEVALSCDNIGICYHRLADYQNALDSYNRSLTIVQALYGESHHTIATVLNNIGNVYIDQGRYNEAFDTHQQSLEIRRKAFGEDSLDVAATYNNIGVVAKCQGRFDTALENYVHSLDIRMKKLGENHPDVASSHNNIGLVYKNQGKLDQSLRSFKRSIEVYKCTLGERHPNLASVYQNLGLVHQSLNRAEDALSNFELALSIFRENFGENHPDVASCLHNIGSLHASSNRFTEALSSYNTSLKIKESLLGKEHKSLASTYNNIGAIYSRMERYELQDLRIRLAYFFPPICLAICNSVVIDILEVIFLSFFLDTFFSYWI